MSVSVADLCVGLVVHTWLGGDLSSDPLVPMLKSAGIFRLQVTENLTQTGFEDKEGFVDSLN